MYRGSGMRVGIAVLIALVGILAYFFRTQTNPVTGERQHVAMTVEQETALGLNTAPEMAAQMGGEAPPGDPDARFVAQVGAAVVAKSDASKGPYKYRFHLLNDRRTINAFALPGGQIFITRGLLSRLKTEGQLAAVLGHEVGHVVNRHGAEHLAKSQLANSITIAVGVGASQDSRTAAAIAAIAGQMIQLKYSRKDELEADQYGLQYMTQTGFDPNEMLHVMEILEEGSKQSRSELMSTHPRTESRIAGIREWIKTHYPQGVPSSLTPGRAFRRAD